MYGRRMRSRITLLFFATSFLLACSGGSGSSSGGAGAGAGGSTSTPTGGGGTTGSTGGTGTGGSGGAATPLVINEISATGEEFVEIVNPTSDAISLADYALADTDPVTSAPKTADAARFPQGTMIAAGEHLVVLCGQAAADGVGPHATCGTGGPASCFYATWNVSAKNGEKVYLLSPADEILAEAPYPQNAAAVGNSWGRFPDATGAFTETVPTPGKANATP